MLQNLPEYVVFVNALSLGWVIIDVIANLFLKKSKKGTKIRFFGAKWLKRKDAIIIALLQFLLAFFLSVFINDYFLFLFSTASLYIIPITFVSIGVLYLYILLGLPYKITLKRCSLSIILFLLALFLFYLIQQSQAL